MGILKQGLEKGKRRPSPVNWRQGAGEVGRGLLGMHFKHLQGPGPGLVGWEEGWEREDKEIYSQVPVSRSVQLSWPDVLGKWA